MGEEAKKEEPKAEAKPEESKEEEKKEEKTEEKEEGKKEEAKPSSPPPTVLFLDLHCVGCAKKIERTIMKCRGVEAVEVDMAKNQVTVKGIVDPQALCERIRKRTMRNAKVLSPLPPAEGDATKIDAPAPQNVSGVTTVELHVNMHCEACARLLQRKILKMTGVQAAETNLISGKVTVTGTMNADKLVEYVYRRTRKLAKVVPQPPKEEEAKEEEGEKPSQEEKGENKEEEKAEKKEEEKPSQQQDDSGEGGKEEKPEEGEGSTNPVTAVVGEDDMAKKMMYWGAAVYGAPIYVIERLPPPQLFSDENPNACCIS
uniref:HMA domain-containing protein n=1 Tax=Anthurium amnicola TaxID=1678845 RepID=A0A1D1XJH0_9ARAE